MTLRGVKPEIVKPSKPKFLLSGRSGVGKTHFALNFPKPYFIDTEGGATRSQYMKKLIESSGTYYGKEHGSQDFKSVIEQLKELATGKHDYKTLIIDSFSKLYNVTAAIAEEEIGSEYGRDKKEANKPTRQLMRWIDKMDLTAILICHQKDKWERKGKEVIYGGTTFDGWEKLEYDLDLWIEIQLMGSERSFVIKKSRIEAFPLGREFPLEYSKFCDLYGKEVIDAPVKPLVMANPEQIAEIGHLIEVVRLDTEIVEKWLNKANADSWDEMSTDQIQKCIDFIKAKIEPAKPAKEKEKPNAVPA